MEAVNLGRRVVLALDPVLLASGFQAGQCGGDPQGDVQVIFCAGHDEFSRRHPGLPQARQDDPEAICVDLVVDVAADGTLVRADLEGSSLEHTLLRAGWPVDAEAVGHLGGRPLTESLPVIEAALRRLFGDPD